MKEEVLENGKEALQKEIDALELLKNKLDENFVHAVELLYKCRSKVVITGMGKSGIIGKKIAATLTSTGTPAFFLSPAEGSHGDLGLIIRGDIVIALSKSGETDEIVKILPYLKRFNVKLITMTSCPKSIIAKNSDIILDLGVVEEACPLNLAPTSSTTAQLVLGDAIAVALLKMKDFTEEDFALYHPGGLLSKQLLKVKDLMHKGDSLPLVNENEDMKHVISKIIEKKLGIALIIDNAEKLKGVIVDGDLKRILMKTGDFMHEPAKKFMTTEPKMIDKDELVAKALTLMEGKITSLVIKNDNDEPVGLLHIHDILKSGVV
ncbi:MAG: KpsF/GutQ family sugar-phosphate isomerase [Spirochaetes bacterium]|nr:KpsF/GutQ family sugar-phosphate isomerase [Spirochaetota bacterium]